MDDYGRDTEAAPDWLSVQPLERETSYTLVHRNGVQMALFADGSYGEWVPAYREPTAAAKLEKAWREAHADHSATSHAELLAEHAEIIAEHAEVLAEKASEVAESAKNGVAAARYSLCPVLRHRRRQDR